MWGREDMESKGMCRQGQRLEFESGKAMAARTFCQGLGKLKGGFLSRPQGDEGPVNTCLWTSGFQKCTQWSLAVNLSFMVICFASHRNQHSCQSESVSPPVPKEWLQGWSCRTDGYLQALSLYLSSLCPGPTKINLMKFTCTNSPFTSGFCLRLASNGSWGQRKRSVFLTTLFLQSQAGSVCCEGHGSSHVCPTCNFYTFSGVWWLRPCMARAQQLVPAEVACLSSWCSITPPTALSTVLLFIS